MNKNAKKMEKQTEAHHKTIPIVKNYTTNIFHFVCINKNFEYIEKNSFENIYHLIRVTQYPYIDKKFDIFIETPT